MITGSSGFSTRKRSSTSKPFILGITRSRTRTSGHSCLICSRHSTPSRAIPHNSIRGSSVDRSSACIRNSFHRMLRITAESSAARMRSGRSTKVPNVSISFAFELSRDDTKQEHFFPKALRSKWLHQKLICAIVQRGSDKRMVGLSRHHHYLHLRTKSRFAQRFDALQPIHHRHIHVEQHQVKRLFRCK